MSAVDAAARRGQIRAAPEPQGVSRAGADSHGRRLTAAFEALDTLPVLDECRRRLLTLFEQENRSTADLVAAIESDLAMTLLVLRFANRVPGKTRGKIDSVVKALEVLHAEGVQRIATKVRTFDFFDRGGAWDAEAERHRLHGLATQRATNRIAAEIGESRRDRLMVASLLHDIGKLVLSHAYPGYPDQVHGAARTPEERLNRERRELGVDHALVGGVIARRWGLPKPLASAIERHHAEDAQEDAAIIRAADMLAHYGSGDTVSPAELTAVSRRVGLSRDSLRTVMYELPTSAPGRQRQLDPCPLSDREVEVLRRLATGKVYKQIASELSLSTSTVRTHLHNIYGKVGAVDRAQAVLVATQRGWI
jgi:putative nucleotidyltransferase with HDIG domain